MLDCLYKPFTELKEYEKLKSLKPGVKEISGVFGSGKSHIIYGTMAGLNNLLVICDDEARARELMSDYRLYNPNALYYPPKDLIFYQADLSGKLLMQERMNALNSIANDSEVAIFTTIDALFERSCDLKRVLSNILSLKTNSEIDEKEIAKVLVRLGYEKEYQVEAPGQFSVRGGIIDIYSLTEDNPYRIELWGDEIESIRTFDPISQRSIDNLSEISIFPASDLILSQEEKLRGLLKIEEEAKDNIEKLNSEFHTQEAYRLKSLVASLREYITEGGAEVDLSAYSAFFCDTSCSLLELFDKESTLIVFDEPKHLSDRIDGAIEEFKESMLHRLEGGYVLPSQTDILISKAEFEKMVSNYCAIAFNSLSSKHDLYKSIESLDIKCESITSYQNSFEGLLKDLNKYKKNKYRTLLLSPSRTRGMRLAQELLDNGLNAFFSEDLRDREINSSEIMVSRGYIEKGFEYPDIKFVAISESDIFTRQKRKKRKHKKYEGIHISSFSELNVGDFVVHENHGLGIYRGIEQIEVNHIRKDYMKIEYRGGSNLYVLATGLDVIQKYASSDGKAPKLNKLGGAEWKKTKARVKGAVSEIAHELVELYAKRQNDSGYVYGPDTVWQKEFEEMFPFEETEDQALAIEATKSDMESTKIMDRLICGDVGFGKTEVAIRAAFKAVQEGKQVALLVPTTILAEQHYNTFCERMKNFPVQIELLCRFKTPSEIKRSISELKKGMADIAIGTHRLLSSDVEFKDLGLLIIDEEQRFGVSHKEKIKQMRQNVDVLALSATPIPRTLHMSLVGIRDMSVLEEPPQDRLPIQTFVMEYNDEMIREAINRELKRGGQVYYVYNRVNTIADLAANIKKLVPAANIAYAHGQMKETELEAIMHDFVSGEIDVLISTTIIETGMDIPNVNTIIVHDSDRMGLSQLYQLRGRVGRSNRTAYAFLMYKRDKLLKEEAEKRLSVIKEYTELGSGFKIAMKDLEIRGAGNILGHSQHGHMEAVGYDLYCKMLNEAVKCEKGGKEAEDFNTTVDVNMDAYIPDSYVSSEFAKLDLYKRIAVVESKEEAEDIVDEMTDRYGSVPIEVKNLIEVSLLRVLAHKVYVEELSDKEKTIQIRFYENARLNPGNFPDLLYRYEGKLNLKTAGKPCLIYTKDKDDYDDPVKLIRLILTDMQVLLD